MKADYRGPFLTDTGIARYEKSDGVSPKGTSVMRLSRDRYLVISVLNDLGGWDMNPAIVYQIRKVSPVGKVLARGIAMEEDTCWKPFGIRLSRCPQTSFAFGVPKGALRSGGSAYPQANVFVLQTFINPQLYLKGEAMLAHAAGRYPNWPGSVDPQHLIDALPRVYWRHFRLNDQEDDIEFLGDWELLHQTGYEGGYGGGFCEYGQGCVTMHGGFSPPLPADDTCEVWYAVAGFGIKSGLRDENLRGIAPLTYSWNPVTKRYRWNGAGPLTLRENWRLTEPGLVRMDDEWLVIARGSNRSRSAIDTRERRGNDSFWFRTADLMAGLGEASQSAIEGNVPRMAYRCHDGALRIVFPEERWIPLAPGEEEPFIAYDPARGKYSRDPLVMYDVDPGEFTYGNRRVLFDAAIHARVIATPAADLVTITPPVKSKQWLLFRLKDRDSKKLGMPTARLNAMGSHCVELSFDRTFHRIWRF